MFACVGNGNGIEWPMGTPYPYRHECGWDFVPTIKCGFFMGTIYPIECVYRWMKPNGFTPIAILVC